MTSPESVLATFPPALVAEANMLRERFAHRYHSSTIYGMTSRNRRVEPSSRELLGSNLDRHSGDASRRAALGKLIEADGAPLVDTDALKAMIRLLRVVQVMTYLLVSQIFSRVFFSMDVTVVMVYNCSHCIRVSYRGFF